jgi:hypothetical protein
MSSKTRARDYVEFCCSQFLLFTVGLLVYLATAPLVQVIPNTNGMSLLLLRDAKSVLDSTGEVDDFFRPLQPEGNAEASAMGSFLHTHYVPLPDLAIVSPALRARQTLDAIMRTWRVPPGLLRALHFQWSLTVTFTTRSTAHQTSVT